MSVDMAAVLVDDSARLVADAADESIAMATEDPVGDPRSEAAAIACVTDAHNLSKEKSSAGVGCAGCCPRVLVPKCYRCLS